MRKSLAALSIILVFCFACAVKVSADFGPKPSITIKAKNMPDTVCYMDLLIEDGDMASDSAKFTSPEYDQELIGRLRNFNYDGWKPALINDLYMMSGDVVCNIKDGKCTSSYGYRVPVRFMIVVADKNGNLVVSNMVERKAFNSVVYFDFKNANAKERAFPISYLFQFITTCMATLILEGLVLLLFGFGLKENLKPFLYINIATQLFLTLAVFYGMYFSGAFAAIALYALAEIIIFIMETILFAVFLKQHSKARRVVFSIAANFVSLLSSTVVILLIDTTLGW